MHPKEGKNTGTAARLRLCAESGIVENCNDYQKTFKLAACVPLTKMLLLSLKSTCMWCCPGEKQEFSLFWCSHAQLPSISYKKKN